MADKGNIVSELIEGLQKGDPRFKNLSRSFSDQSSPKYKAIPFDQLGDLSQLRVLSIKDHDIRQVGSPIGQMTNLGMLDLSDNPLEELPQEIGNLKGLEILSLSYTAQIDFEWEMDQLKAPGNYPKYIGEGGLKSLPNSFANLKNLKSLKLDNCRFKEIPDAIFELKNLQSLDLWCNE
jgi:Leucine-rich repeat (LRR) protein